VSTEKQFEKKKRGYHEHFISDDNTCIVIGWKNSKRLLLSSNLIGIQGVQKTLGQRKTMQS